MFLFQNRETEGWPVKQIDGKENFYKRKDMQRRITKVNKINETNLRKVVLNVKQIYYIKILFKLYVICEYIFVIYINSINSIHLCVFNLKTYTV